MCGARALTIRTICCAFFGVLCNKSSSVERVCRRQGAFDSKHAVSCQDGALRISKQRTIGQSARFWGERALRSSLSDEVWSALSTK